MREIPLSCGKIAQVDDEDYEWLIEFGYRRHKGKYTDYACTSHHKMQKLMHRLIAEKHHLLSDDFPFVDHIDGNGLNNQKVNLRACSMSQNGCNRRMEKGNQSGFKGVHFHQGLWRTEIRLGNLRIRKSGFRTKEEAAIFYNEQAIILHGLFAKLNDV